MAQVGSAYDDLASHKLQSRIDKFNTSQSAPWNRLQAYYNGMVGGPAGIGGTSTTTVRQPSDWFGGAMNGALKRGSFRRAWFPASAPAAALSAGLLGLLSGL